MGRAGKVALDRWNIPVGRFGGMVRVEKEDEKSMGFRKNHRLYLLHGSE